MTSLFLGLSLLLLVGGVFGRGECPPNNAIKPCHCTRSSYPVTVQCSDIHDMDALESIFERAKDYPIHKLDLIETKLMYIPSALLKANNFEYMTMVNCSMATLFDAPLEAGNKLLQLTLVNTTVQRGLIWEQFENNLSLEEFQAENVLLRGIGASFAKFVPETLRKLNLVNTKTRTISPEALKKFSNLQSFVVIDGRLSTLDRKMFSIPSRLNFLDLTGNRIESLPDDMFTNMPELSQVILKDNRFTFFSEALFGRAYDRNLMFIDLLGNPLVCDCRVQWFMRRDRYVRLNGLCSQPTKLNGRGLRQLTEQDFLSCPKL